MPTWTRASRRTMRRWRVGRSWWGRSPAAGTGPDGAIARHRAGSGPGPGHIHDLVALDRHGSVEACHEKHTAMRQPVGRDVTGRLEIAQELFDLFTAEADDGAQGSQRRDGIGEGVERTEGVERHSPPGHHPVTAVLGDHRTGHAVGAHTPGLQRRAGRGGPEAAGVEDASLPRHVRSRATLHGVRTEPVGGRRGRVHGGARAGSGDGGAHARTVVCVASEGSTPRRR